MIWFILCNGVSSLLPKFETKRLSNFLILQFADLDQLGQIGIAEEAET